MLHFGWNTLSIKDVVVPQRRGNAEGWRFCHFHRRERVQVCDLFHLAEMIRVPGGARRTESVFQRFSGDEPDTDLRKGNLGEMVITRSKM
jgi:hypothetical protein